MSVEVLRQILDLVLSQIWRLIAVRHWSTWHTSREGRVVRKRKIVIHHEWWVGGRASCVAKRQRSNSRNDHAVLRSM